MRPYSMDLRQRVAADVDDHDRPGRDGHNRPTSRPMDDEDQAGPLERFQPAGDREPGQSQLGPLARAKFVRPRFILASNCEPKQCDWRPLGGRGTRREMETAFSVILGAETRQRGD
jgi:hypothetical protein